MPERNWQKDLELWKRVTCMPRHNGGHIEDVHEVMAALRYWLQRVRELEIEVKKWQEEAEMLGEECDKMSADIRKYEDVLVLAHKALTEGMEDVPPQERNPKCSRLRIEAKRVIRKVLGWEAKNNA